MNSNDNFQAKIDNQPSYFAVIPADVRYDKDLIPNAKLLYGELTALSNKTGYCWATNAYFADLYQVTERAIQKWVKDLCDKGYISLGFEYKQNSNEISRRFIYINGVVNKNSPRGENEGGVVNKSSGGGEQKFGGVVNKSSGGGEQKFIHNNTIINNTDKNNTINNPETEKIENSTPIKTEKAPHKIIEGVNTPTPAGGFNETSVPAAPEYEPPYWRPEVSKFLNDFYFKSQFCKAKGIELPDLENKMSDFVITLNLKMDYKDAAGLKRHFTNHYKKYFENKPQSKNIASHGFTEAPDFDFENGDMEVW